MGYHPETKERRKEGTRYFLVELVDFVTIIDVYGNESVFKIQMQKGNGLHRLNKADQIRVAVNIQDYEGNSLWKYSTPEEGSKSFQIYLLG